MEIREWQREVHELAREKGWHDGADPDSTMQILAWLALAHSEISEAVEAARVRSIEAWVPINGTKPEGLVIELADAVIRIMDMCEAMGLDLQDAIELKHEYNKTRPHRHGGKLA